MKNKIIIIIIASIVVVKLIVKTSSFGVGLFIIVGFIFWLFLHKPRIGMILLIIFRPIIDITWGIKIPGIGVNLLYVVGGIFPLLGVVVMIRERIKFLSLPLAKLWGMFLFLNLLSSIYLGIKEKPIIGLNFFCRILNGGVAFYLIPHLFNSLGKVRKLLLSFIIATGIPLFMGVYQLTFGGLRVQEATGELVRITGLYHDIVNFRLYCIQCIATILLYTKLYQNYSTLRRSVFFLLLCSAIVVLYFSYTKAGWCIFLLWVVMWYLLIKEYIKSILIIISISVLLLFSTTFTSSLQTLFHKEIKYFKGEKIPITTLLQGRIGRWGKGFYLFKKLPLPNKLLIGMGDFFWCTQGAHNDFLRVLWANGVIGITIYLLLWLNIIKNLWQNIRTNKEITIFGILLTLMITVDSLGITPSMYPNYQWFVLSCIGLSVHNFSTKNQNT